MKIYIAGPLFCQSELEFNDKLAVTLRNYGFDVFLPQEVSGVKEKMEDSSTDKIECMTETFIADLKEIDSSDALLLIMDGRVPDEGACFELGYAYSKGKQCFGLKTDIRVSEFGMDNAMLVGSLRGHIAKDVDSLITLLSRELCTIDKPLLNTK